jgi:Trp operon repressor
MEPPKKKKVTPIFLYDPTKSGPITITASNYNVLEKHEFVGTTLCDYLIQRSILPEDLPDNTVVPSTEFINEMGIQLDKLKCTDRVSKTSITRTRNKFNYFGLQKHTIIASACLSDHFFVISVTFDASKEDVFERVDIYDSISSSEVLSVQSRVSTRSGKGIAVNTRGAQYLMRLQEFLNEFAFHDNDEVYSRLKQDPKLILRKASYNSCPQQSNGYDCSLFGFVTLLHLARGITITENIFTQEDITKFRLSLHTLLSSDIQPDPRKLLSPNYVTLFFPSLDGKVKDGVYDSHVQFYNNSQNEMLVLGYCSAPSTI